MRRAGIEGFPAPRQAKVESLRISTEPIPGGFGLAGSGCCVELALSKLKDADREILMLSTWEELSAPEIGTALDISTGAAEQRLHRAKQRFTKHLDKIPNNAHLSPRVAEEGGER